MGFGVAGVAWHHGGCGGVSLVPVGVVSVATTEVVGGVSLVPLGVVPISKSTVKFLKWRSYLRNYCDLIVKWQQCCGLADA